MANSDTSEKQQPSDDVIVPMGIYKVVTVFSTLIAAAAVVGGFIIIDMATQGGTAPLEEVNVIVALAGVGAILLGSGIYVFSTRFRTEGMGSPKDGAD
jgi:hypothetical protein